MRHKIFNFQRSIKNSLSRPDLKNQKGAATILIAYFILMILLLVSLTAATIIVFEIRMSREIANSIPAFYAADAGAERCLFQTRCAVSGSPSAECIAEVGSGLNGGCASVGNSINFTLDNTAQVTQAKRTLNNQIQSNGLFSGTNRKVELDW